MKTKICSKCKEQKPISEFYGDSRTTDKLYSACKECYRKYRVKKRECLRKKSERWNNKNRRMVQKYGLGVGTVSRYGFETALCVYEKFNRKCSICDSEYDLTIHHLDSKGRNYKEAGLKPNNDRENLILVCRRCHGRIHGGEQKKRRK